LKGRVKILVLIHTKKPGISRYLFKQISFPNREILKKHTWTTIKPMAVSNCRASERAILPCFLTDTNQSLKRGFKETGT
jgi:hypothetical protein